MGEVNRLRQSQPGHLYFELVEKGEADEIVGKLEAVAWRGDYHRIRSQLARVEQELTEGQQIRCRGGLDFYGPFGRLQFVIREVDPVFTTGLLAQRRRETLDALSTAGLLERNKRFLLPSVPLGIGLVTSHDSAAYHDFLATLGEGPWGFEITFVHSAVQGIEAEAGIVSALSMLSDLDLDCIVLIRGGGSRADLAVFDSRAIAEAIARSPLPVLTGLGHEIDTAIADLTAHSSFKTPTGVAEFLLARVAESDRRLADGCRRLGRESLDLLRQGREALGRAQRGLGSARYRLAMATEQVKRLAGLLPRVVTRSLTRHEERIAELGLRFRREAPKILAMKRAQPPDLVGRLAMQSTARLRELHARLAGWEKLCHQLAPERLLARGFSLTRDQGGSVIKRASQVESGQRIRTRLAEGELTSRVEAK